MLILGAWLVWLTWCWLPQPLLIDEVVFAQLAHAPFHQFAHPPAYLHALGLLALGFKLPDAWLRLFGLAMLLLTARSTCHLAERWERGAGVWALWLLLTNPLAVRGAFVLDIDNTLLMWWVVTSVWWLARVQWPLQQRTIVAFGMWWALGLWMKFTTPWLWPLAFWAASAARGEWRRGLSATVLMSAVGLGAFLLVWAAYSGLVGVPWNELLGGRVMAMLQRGATDRGVAMATELAERAARIGLWIGPLPLLAWAAGTWHACRGRRTLRAPEAWMSALILGWGILLGYWAIGGVIWSLARYHCPLVPLVAAVGGAIAARHLRDARVPWGMVAALVGAVALWSDLVVGDPLHLVNYALRHALLFEPSSIRVHLRHLVIGQAALVASVAICGVAALCWRRTWNLTRAGAVVLSLIVGAIGSGAGLAARQSTAAYSTSYCYGRPWATYHAVQRYVLAFHAGHPAARIMAPFDTFQGQIPFKAFLSVFVNEWFMSDTRETFLAALRDPALGLCVMDVDFSSARAVKELWADPQVKAWLDQEFLHIPLGTADGWVRRSLVTQPEGLIDGFRS